MVIEELYSIRTVKYKEFTFSLLLLIELRKFVSIIIVSAGKFSKFCYCYTKKTIFLLNFLNILGIFCA